MGVQGLRQGRLAASDAPALGKHNKKEVDGCPPPYGPFFLLLPDACPAYLPMNIWVSIIP